MGFFINLDLFPLFLLLNSPDFTNYICRYLYNSGFISKLYTYDDYLKCCKKEGLIK